MYDQCLVCGGDGTTCETQLRCNQRASCGQCNILVGAAKVRYCFWCNTTSSCDDYNNEALCAQPAESCPVDQTEVVSGSTTAAANDTGTVAGWLIGTIVASIVVVFTIVMLVYLRARGRGPLPIEAVNFSEHPTFDNPLYEEYSKPFDNPIYENLQTPSLETRGTTFFVFAVPFMGVHTHSSSTYIFHFASTSSFVSPLLAQCSGSIRAHIRWWRFVATHTFFLIIQRYTKRPRGPAQTTY